MSTTGERLVETVTLGQAKRLIACLAGERSLLLLSPPGVGKSDIVQQAAAEANLPCRSLLGTQIAPEDVSGVPHIVGERSVFCPPRMLLPEVPEPFCLFLDELPACAPDVQKAFYSLLLERRIGEHTLPRGTWVVAAGNRSEDRALVRTVSSALVNRVVIVNVRVDLAEWLHWARGAGIRLDVRSFLIEYPEWLQAAVPREPVPFSTPRAWASLSRALDLAEQAGISSPSIRRALVAGRISAECVDRFCDWCENLSVGLSQLDFERYTYWLSVRLSTLDISLVLADKLAERQLHTVCHILMTTSDELIRTGVLNELEALEVEDALAAKWLRWRPSTAV